MISAQSLCKRYPGQPGPALDHLDIHIDQGEFVSILGRSGSGKTTLLHVLSSLVLPDSGQVLYQGRDICRAGEKERNRLRREDFAVIFQQHHLLPHLSALENVLLPFLGRRTRVTAEQRERALLMLERTGIAALAAKRPGQMSGGEQQRVAIARALAQGAKALFADEPTGSLDTATGQAVFSLLGSLNREGMTVLLVTHNPEFAARAGRCLTMRDGRIVDEKNTI